MRSIAILLTVLFFGLNLPRQIFGQAAAPTLNTVPPNSGFSIPHTGFPNAVPNDQMHGCPEGTKIQGTDMVGQIELPENRSNTSCRINFAKPFTKTPVCIANLEIPYENSLTEVPAIVVSSGPSYARFSVGTLTGDMNFPVKINYWCAEAPNPSPLLDTAVTNFPGINSRNFPTEPNPVILPSTTIDTTAEGIRNLAPWFLPK